MSQAYESILDLIGNTPMVRLKKVVDKNSAAILAKLEMFNPGGSVKDRIALNMVEQAEKKGFLKAGSVIILSLYSRGLARQEITRIKRGQASHEDRDGLEFTVVEGARPDRRGKHQERHELEHPARPIGQLSNLSH